MQHRIERSIPACAGEPFCLLILMMLTRVYPRVCGGTGATTSASRPKRGLSPRVRGNRDGVRVGQHDPRSIPACAGEPHLR